MAFSLSKTATHHSQYQLAGFEKRLYACAFDMVLLLFTTLALPFGRSDLVFFLLQLSYFVICWSYFAGQTIGNKIFRIRVITTLGHPLTVKAASIRYFGFLLSELVLCIGFLGIFKDKQQQGWHDKLANTIVIKA